MAEISMNGRGFAPQAGSYQAYQSYQSHAPQPQYVAPEPNASTPQHYGAGPIKAMAALTGAGLSLALLIGVGVWGYQLMARDVTGVPVVRAVQGEMRVRPADPGGAQAQHQGFAVNEIAAAGGTAGPSDRIVLAPEPIDLSADSAPLIDQLVAAQPRFAPSDSESDQAKDTANPAPELAARSETENESNPQLASIEALAAQIAAGATPLSVQGQVDTPPVRTSVAAPRSEQGSATPDPVAVEPALPAAAISSEIAGLAISPRPKLRPEGVRTASLAQSGDVAGVRDIDPDAIPAGTRLVQLGAYESPEIARKEWGRFATKFDAYMEGKDRVIQKAVSGGRTFYRLRAMGFSDLADARRFCSALTAQNTDCIPVVTR